MLSDEHGVVVCGMADTFDRHSPARRAALERIDGPMERVPCPACQRTMLLSARSKAVLESGQASRMICADCLMLAIERLDETLPP